LIIVSNEDLFVNKRFENSTKKFRAYTSLDKGFQREYNKSIKREQPLSDLPPVMDQK
jgi:hypothetical protein